MVSGMDEGIIILTGQGRFVPFLQDKLNLPSRHVNVLGDISTIANGAAIHGLTGGKQQDYKI